MKGPLMLSDAMHRLIHPWNLTITVDGNERAQEFPPLIDMLTERIHPDSSRGGGGGSPATRNVLDVNSLDLYMHIQDVTGAWLQEWGVGGTGDLKADLTLFEHAVHLLDETEHGPLRDRLAAYPDTWAIRIWDLIDPPLTRPLRGTTCPKCGRGKYINDNGDHIDNLVIRWRAGQEVTAECQWRDCAAVWVGRDGLLELGRAVGADFDFDALAELGSK